MSTKFTTWPNTELWSAELSVLVSSVSIFKHAALPPMAVADVDELTTFAITSMNVDRAAAAALVLPALFVSTSFSTSALCCTKNAADSASPLAARSDTAPACSFARPTAAASGGGATFTVKLIDPDAPM